MKNLDALASVLRTQSDRLQIPPSGALATGHEDAVYLWLTRITDAEATSLILFELPTTGEAARIAEHFLATGGLFAKPLPVDVGRAQQTRLSEVGTDTVLLRPDEAVRLLERAES